MTRSCESICIQFLFNIKPLSPRLFTYIHLQLIETLTETLTLFDHTWHAGSWREGHVVVSRFEKP
jgi:hypothetical protein